MNLGMDAALGRSGVTNGSWSEWGVFKGGTLRHMSARYGDRGLVYGFDSFEGLPEAWRPGSPKKRFTTGGRPPNLRLPNVAYVVGLYDATMPPFLNGVRGPAGLVHIDCDLYSAARTVLVGTITITINTTITSTIKCDHEHR